VRNRWNGDVEVMAEGERETLGLLLNVLHRGPRSAFVSRVNVEWLESKGEFTHFGVRSTG
jgi:acylphosphatase